MKLFDIYFLIEYVRKYIIVRNIEWKVLYTKILDYQKKKTRLYIKKNT